MATSNRDARMVVVTALDDTYALPATVMIRSVVDHLSGPLGIDVYVLDCGVSRTSRRKLLRSIPRSWARIHMVDVGETELSGLKVDGYVSSATYARLLLGLKLPRTLKKIIFLDADMLVLCDIRPLWDTEMAGHCLAAVQDPVAGVVGVSSGMTHWSEWGIAPGTLYFNAGLMLVDLDGWRKEQISEKALAAGRAHPERIRWWDQDALNIIFRGDFLSLDPAWNVMPQVLYPEHAENRVYDADTILRCVRHPKVIHYSAGYKPWRGPNRHVREADFFRILHRTAWRNDVWCAPWLGRGNTLWTKLKRKLKYWLLSKNLLVSKS